MLMLALTAFLASQGGAAPIGPGISEELARERAAVIRDVRFELHLTIPEPRQEPIQGRVRVRFTLAAPHRVVLDFAQPRERVRSVRSASGPGLQFEVEDNHIIIPAAGTRAGQNELVIDFVAGDEPLNRTDEFLYTLFVPARAHLAFPAFDQPNLKTRYTLTLDVPAGWQAVSNAAGTVEAAGAGQTRVRFAETPPLPSYLFAFAAGRFSIETATRNGRALRMFHRETDTERLARNRDAIFDLHAAALAWLEDYTGIPYPWGKFDFVMIPAFQFSGMEHPGAIYYNAALFLDASATQQQLLGRASTIAHETAHMWFGNLVTMEWFSDVWMKEVFANFMAAKIVNPSFPELDHDLRFLLAHYPAAYEVDRTAGSNPIRQPLANLSEAGQLYGPIIYQKAPIVMRQLELIVGEDALRDGLREYLKTYAFGNASWIELVRILDHRTPEDLASWSRAWVEERGRPVFSTELQTLDNRIVGLLLDARDPLQRGLVWPQRLTVTLGYAGAVEQVPALVSGASVSLGEAVGRPVPLYVLPSGAGLGYGFFVLDAASRRYLLEHLEDIPHPLTRGAAWVTVWENLVGGYIAPAEFVALAERAIPRERDEQIRQRALSYLARAFWRSLDPEERVRRAPALERMLRAGIEGGESSRQKAAWFNAFRAIVLTPDGLSWLERIWRREEQVTGLPFAETDEIAMAFELAVREVPGWAAILDTQHARTQDPDRRDRVAFVMPALSADPAVREQAFERFRRVEHRRREPWVIESLAYLNHPLRERHARRFVRLSLELLGEIQRTGDIFFPARWIDAVLGAHRSHEVAEMVREFLAASPTYPQRLRWTILAAADHLLRDTP